jgi:hypothetical protein
LVVAFLPTPGNANTIKVVGNLAFLGDSRGLDVINIANPLTPTLIASLTVHEVLDLAVANDQVYLVGFFGLEIVDVRNPSNPRVTHKLHFSNQTASTVDVAAGVAVIGTQGNDGEVVIVDLHGAEPQIVGTTSLPPGFAPNEVAIRNSLAYVATSGDMFVVDFSSPANPQIVGRTAAQGIQAVQTVGSYALGARYRGLSIFGLDSPQNPAFIGSIDFSSLGSCSGTGVAATPEDVYLASADSKLYVGRYLVLQDTAGNSPTVAIESPRGGSSAFENESLIITATTSDDIGVRGVDFLVGGVVVGTDTVPPYRLVYDVPSGRTNVTIGARATDYGGNVGTAAPVTINVVHDSTPPTVRIVSPLNGESVPGSTARVRADASDDLSVAAVEFYVNGMLTETRTAPPYQVDVPVPAGATSLVFGVKARDVAGNIGVGSNVTVAFMQPSVVGSLSLPGRAFRAVVNGTFAYVAAGTAGLEIVDFSTPAAPALVGSLTVPNREFTDLRVLGNLVYLSSADGLDIVDVSVPATPSMLGHLDSTRAPIAVTGTKVYRSLGSNIDVIDIAVPSAPGVVASFPVIGGNDFGAVLQVDHDLVFLATNSRLSGWSSSITVHDFHDVAHPEVLVGFGCDPNVNSIAVSNGRVAVARTSGLTVSDFNDFLLDTRDISPPAKSVDFGGHYLTAGMGQQLQLFDASDPLDPLLLATIDLSSLGNYDNTSVALGPTLLTATAYDTANGVDSQLAVVQYRAIQDTGGRPPTATLTAPKSGASATSGRLLSLRADAQDDVGVAAVTFTVNGVDVFTDTMAPFEYNYLVPSAATTITIVVRATDFGGNVTASQNVVVPVLP